MADRNPVDSPLAHDIGREAVDSARGYNYQILHSVLAWLQLREGEVLYLEGAEDLDRVGLDEASLTQVKDTAGSGSITLRTPGVTPLACNPIADTEDAATLPPVPDANPEDSNRPNLREPARRPRHPNLGAQRRTRIEGNSPTSGTLSWGQERTTPNLGIDPTS
jgi:hypothetical protein